MIISKSAWLYGKHAAKDARNQLKKDIIKDKPRVSAKNILDFLTKNDFFSYFSIFK